MTTLRDGTKFLPAVGRFLGYRVADMVSLNHLAMRRGHISNDLGAADMLMLAVSARAAGDHRWARDRAEVALFRYVAGVVGLVADTPQELALRHALGAEVTRGDPRATL